MTDTGYRMFRSATLYATRYYRTMRTRYESEEEVTGKIKHAQRLMVKIRRRRARERTLA